MASKSLIIHIGTQKTGSSALQVSLTNNTQLLSENDIHFLKYSWQKSAYVLREIDWRDEARLELERQNLKAMIDGVTESTVVLSCSEYIGDLDTSYADAREMAKKLDTVTKGYKRKIVVYIRRQDLLIESSYAQYVKQGASYSFEDFMQKYDGYQFDWYKLLGTYREIFSVDNLVIKSYEKSQLFDGDVVKDFCNIIGINSQSGLKKPAYSNHGYSRAGLEIARVYNKIHARNNEKKTQLRNMLQNRMPKRKYDSFYFLSFADREAILAFYEESNRNVAKEYLKKENELLFEASLDEYASKQIRSNRLIFTDVVECFTAFVLKPLAAKIRQIMGAEKLVTDR